MRELCYCQDCDRWGMGSMWPTTDEYGCAEEGPIQCSYCAGFATYNQREWGYLHPPAPLGPRFRLSPLAAGS